MTCIKVNNCNHLVSTFLTLPATPKRLADPPLPTSQPSQTQYLNLPFSAFTISILAFLSTFSCCKSSFLSLCWLTSFCSSLEFNVLYWTAHTPNIIITIIMKIGALLAMLPAVVLGQQNVTGMFLLSFYVSSSPSLYLCLP
jgi:hypothetical protein